MSIKSWDFTWTRIQDSNTHQPKPEGYYHSATSPAQLFSLSVPDATTGVEDHEADPSARPQQTEDHQRDGGEF